MNNTNNTSYIPKEALELIPWFAIGKLSEDAKDFFEKALLSHPSLQKLLQTEKQMIELVSADKSLLDRSVIAPKEERLKSVLNVIDNLETATKAHSESNVRQSLFEKLKNTFFSLIPISDSKPQYAQFASVSALVLSIAILASIVNPSTIETSEFIPASAVTQATENQASLVSATKTILLVGFHGSPEELSNNDALKGKQMKIDSPTDKEGFFQISFQDSMSKDEVKQTLDALLKQKESVWFAGEAF